MGQDQPLWRALGALIVVLLAGAAVALAGPVGFVGLIVPHIARLIVGADYRWIIPFSALGGALLTVPPTLWRVSQCPSRICRSASPWQ